MNFKTPECDCEVVDDPDMVCPKHEKILYEYIHKLEDVARAADTLAFKMGNAVPIVPHIQGEFSKLAGALSKFQ